MMKFLVTGVKGQLGFDIVKNLTADGHKIKGVDAQDFDITDRTAVFEAIASFAPDMVIHCAAYTAVDKAEEEPDKVTAVNAQGTKHIADACVQTGAALCYFSTDYVFDGKGDTPYEINAPIAPQSVYGRTKQQGESYIMEHLQRYFILRISWVFGINGANFVKTMLQLAQTHDTIRVVSDQIGSPTYTADVANLVRTMVQTQQYGVYHVTNEGFCSWYDFACAIFQQSGLAVTVQPISTDDYPTKAVRPHNSRLSKHSLDAAGFFRLPSWQDALQRYLEEQRSKTKNG